MTAELTTEGAWGLVDELECLVAERAGQAARKGRAALIAAGLGVEQLPARPARRATVPLVAWTAKAACAGVDLATSVRMTDALSQAEVVDLRESLCRACPVREACLGLGRASWGWGLFGGVVLAAGEVAPQRLRPTERAVTIEESERDDR